MVDISKYYSPHPGQRQVHALKAREKYLRIGRRWGKSRAGLGELILAYTDFLESPFVQGMVPGFHSWVVCPNYPQGRQTWHELMQFLPKEFVSRTLQEDYILYLHGRNGINGDFGLVELKSSHEPDSLQTVGLDFLWVNEAQDVSDKAYEKLLPTLRSPGRMRRAVYEGIPPLWPEHWFHRGYEMAKRSRDPSRYATFTATAFDNPMLTKDEIKDIEDDRDKLPDNAWRRMYLAEFSMNSGFFKNIEGCVAGELLGEPVPGKNYVAGLDLGVSRSFTVLTVFDADERRVVYHQMWDSMPWPDVRAQIASLHGIWNIQRLVCDATGMGIQLVQELEESGLPTEAFQIVGQHRQDLLAELQVALERVSITFPPIPIMLRQLRGFQYRRTRTGSFKAEAAPGENDDEVFALALGLTACNDAAPVEPLKSMSSGRYMPTQAESVGGINYRSQGRKLMGARRTQRMRDRMDRSSIPLS
jgi:hypothetical protein